ncbi:MAG: hypothetical protein J7M19_04800 [Planctomycetes bacterium]|nr:hypothetical protein [Planctomycetota bacterium]
MSDDIREVMRPTPFSPLKRVGKSGKRKKGSGGRTEGDEENEAPQAEEGEISDAELETLARDVETANQRLAKAGRDVRLRLAEGVHAPLVEIILPDKSGAELVTRRIKPSGFEEWVQRLESGEGLIIDEEL